MATEDEKKESVLTVWTVGMEEKKEKENAAKEGKLEKDDKLKYQRAAAEREVEGSSSGDSHAKSREGKKKMKGRARA